MNQHVKTNPEDRRQQAVENNAQERARELLLILEAKFATAFPGMGSVFDPEMPEVPKESDSTEPVEQPGPCKVASPAELQAQVIEFAKYRPYRTPRATVDAFRYVLQNYDDDYVERWLADHPRDSAYLLNLLGRVNEK
jgi:hypothetical protein